jgi:hypothetical protein
VGGAATVNASEIDNGSTAGGGCPATLGIAKGDHTATGLNDCDTASFTSSVTFGCSETGSQTVTLQVSQPDGQKACCMTTVTITDPDTDGDGTSDCNDTDRAMTFDGDDLVVVPNAPSLNPAEITVECWVNFGRLAYGPGYSGTDSQSLVGKGGDQITGSFWMRQGGSAPDSYFLQFGIGPFWLGNGLLSPAALETNRWYHMAGTYDGQTIRLYLDGTLSASNQVGRIPIGNDSPLYFGYHDMSGWAYYLSGQLDEIRVWNYARSEEQIRATMHSSLPCAQTGLVGFWRFNEEIADQIVSDSSGAGNNGTRGIGPDPAGDDPARVPSTCPIAVPDDADGDGVDNACDNCPNTIPGATVDAAGCPPLVPGDFERDGDVDDVDLQHFKDCMTGEAIAQEQTNCANAKLDGDDDVDLSDFGIFQWCLSGENNLADPNCAN